jgi:hypothetical protein
MRRAKALEAQVRWARQPFPAKRYAAFPRVPVTCYGYVMVEKVGFEASVAFGGAASEQGPVLDMMDDCKGGLQDRRGLFQKTFLDGFERVLPGDRNGDIDDDVVLQALGRAGAILELEFDLAGQAFDFRMVGDVDDAEVFESVAH